MSQVTRAYLGFYIILIIALFIVSMPLIWPSHSFQFTDEELKFIAELKTLRAVGDNNFPPFSFSQHDQPLGYEADLVNALQRVLGVEIILEQYAWTKVREMLESGQADFITGMRVTAERLAEYKFTQPYLVTSHAMVVPQSSTAEKLEDLRGLRVVAQQGSSTYERLVNEGYVVLGVLNPQEAYNWLSQGLADAWIEHEWVARYYIGPREVHQWHVRSLTGTRGDYAIATSIKANPLLISVLSKALKKLRHEGALRELDTRWFGPALQEVEDKGREQLRVLVLVFGIASLGLGLVLNNSYLQYRVQKQTQELSQANLALSRQQEKLQQLLLNAGRAFGIAIEVKDIYTGGHSQRVAKAAYAIAREMQLSEEECFSLCLGALMHDIGKVGVSDRILAKTERLTAEEFAAIRLHPQVGESILRNMEGYDRVREIVLYHHERWDGKVDSNFPAYPGHKRGTDIPLGARIVAVADAFDAMTSDRPYRKARSIEEALAALEESAGTQFDPAVVSAAVKALGRITDINELPYNETLGKLLGNTIEL